MRILRCLFIFVLVNFGAIFGQKNVWLQSPPEWMVDTGIRSSMDSITFNLQEGSSARDAGIYSIDSSLNFGRDTTFYIGNDTLQIDSAGVGRGLLQSDSVVNGIPGDALILSVTLTAYRDTADTAYGAGIAGLFEISSGWVEGDSNFAIDTVNWISRLKGGSAADWDSSGGDYVFSDMLDTVSFSPTVDSLKFGSTDSLVALVQGWIDGTVANNGVMIRALDESLGVYYPMVLSDDTVRTGLRYKWRITYVLPFNFGADSTVGVGRSLARGDTLRPLFENDSIQVMVPGDASVTVARFIVYGTVDSSLGSDSGWVYLYKVDSSFSEGGGTASADNDTANWTQRLKVENGGPTLWNTAGGDFRNVVLDSVWVVTGETDSLIFEGDSVAAQVERWAAGIDSNNGVILIAEDSADFRYFVQTSDDTLYTGRWPVWDIWFTTPGAASIHPLRVFVRTSDGTRATVFEDSLRAGVASGADTANWIGNFYSSGGYMDGDSVASLFKADSLARAAIKDSLVNYSTSSIMAESLSTKTTVLDVEAIVADSFGVAAQVLRDSLQAAWTDSIKVDGIKKSGLALYVTGDTLSNGNFADFSGLENDGTNNGVTVISGDSGIGLQAMSFDSSKLAFISMGDNSNLDFGTSSFTIIVHDVFSKSTSVIGNQVLIAKRETSGGFTGYQFGIEESDDGTNPNGIVFTIDGPGASIAGEVTNIIGGTNKKHQIAVVVNYNVGVDTTATIYIDGKIGVGPDNPKNIASVGNINNSEPFQIGRLIIGEATTYFDGTMGIVEIYSRALSQAEIQDRLNNTATYNLFFTKANKNTDETIGGSWTFKQEVTGDSSATFANSVTGSEFIQASSFYKGKSAIDLLSAITFEEGTEKGDWARIDHSSLPQRLQRAIKKFFYEDSKTNKFIDIYKFEAELQAEFDKLEQGVIIGYVYIYEDSVIVDSIEVQTDIFIDVDNNEYKDMSDFKNKRFKKIRKPAIGESLTDKVAMMLEAILELKREIEGLKEE